MIGLADMVNLATEAAKTVREPFIFFVPVAMIYLALTTVSEWTFRQLNRRYSAGVVEG